MSGNEHSSTTDTTTVAKMGYGKPAVRLEARLAD